MITYHGLFIDVSKIQTTNQEEELSCTKVFYDRMLEGYQKNFLEDQLREDYPQILDDEYNEGFKDAKDAYKITEDI